MIFSPLTALSQTANIDLANKTVTLDEAKTIDIAKIVENEKRLKDENSKLLEIIRKQDSLIQHITQRNIEGLQAISLNNEKLASLSGEINKLATKQLELEEKKNYAGRFFLSFQYDINNPYFKSGYITATYFTKKNSFGISINPLNDKMIYGVELGILIF